jgi:hypothetical protein
VQRCTLNLMERTIGSWETTIACDRTRVALENNKTHGSKRKFLGGHQVQQLRVFSKSVARKEQPTSGRKHAALSRSSRDAPETFSKKHSTFRIVSAPRHRNVKTFRSALMDRLLYGNAFFARAFCRCWKKCAARVLVFFCGARDKQLIKSATQSGQPLFFEPHVTRARRSEIRLSRSPLHFFNFSWESPSFVIKR